MWFVLQKKREEIIPEVHAVNSDGLFVQKIEDVERNYQQFQIIRYQHKSYSYNLVYPSQLEAFESQSNKKVNFNDRKQKIEKCIMQKVDIKGLVIECDLKDRNGMLQVADSATPTMFV